MEGIPGKILRTNSGINLGGTLGKIPKETRTDITVTPRILREHLLDKTRKKLGKNPMSTSERNAQRSSNRNAGRTLRHIPEKPFGRHSVTNFYRNRRTFRENLNRSSYRNPRKRLKEIL